MNRACNPCDGTYNSCRICQGHEPNGWWSPEQAIAGVDISRKVFMVTGANTGIGFVTAQTLLAAGAEVIITTRSAVKTEDTIARLTEGLSENAKTRVKGVSMDLSSLSSIEAGVKEFGAFDIKSLDAICLNAGCFCCEYTETVDGLEMTWAVNHVGQFYLFKLLLHKLKSLTGHTRIVIISSQSAFYWLPDGFSVNTHLPQKSESYEKGHAAYGITKLCDILTAREITKRFAENGISAYS